MTLQQIETTSTGYGNFKVNVSGYYSLEDERHLEKRLKVLSFIKENNLSFYVDNEDNKYVVTFDPEETKEYLEEINFVPSMLEPLPVAKSKILKLENALEKI